MQKKAAESHSVALSLHKNISLSDFNKLGCYALKAIQLV